MKNLKLRLAGATAVLLAASTTAAVLAAAPAERSMFPPSQLQVVEQMMAQGRF